MENNTPAKVFSIAGSDCSGGAGIQADIKAVSAMGCYAAAAITAITAQNTLGVQAVHYVPVDIVCSQIRLVMDDIQPQSIKIGMIGSAAIAIAIAETLSTYDYKHLVVDPVMVSTSGKKLMEDEAIAVIKEKLLPMATLITPNLHEAEILYGEPLINIEMMKEAAQVLAQQYGCSVLVKGGHSMGDDMCDVFHDINTREEQIFVRKKIDSKNLHGTGCTLSSAIAACLAKGMDMCTAINTAKEYVTCGIEKAKDMQIGHGYGPLWHF